VGTEAQGVVGREPSKKKMLGTTTGTTSARRQTTDRMLQAVTRTPRMVETTRATTVGTTTVGTMTAKTIGTMMAGMMPEMTATTETMTERRPG
jgi:hypothetical protein